MTEPNSPTQRSTSEKSWSSGFQAIGTVASLLTDEPSRVLALFLVVVLGAIIAVSAFGVTTGSAWIIVVALLLAFILTGALLWRSFKKQRAARQPRAVESKWRRLGRAIIFIVGGVITMACVVSILLYMNVLQMTFPAMFPDYAAQHAVETFVGGLDEILTQSDGRGRVKALREWAECLTPGAQQRLLTTNLSQLLLDKNADQADTEAAANAYRDKYGRIERVILESVTPAAWRPRDSSLDVNTVYMFAIVRYTGQFCFNDFAERRPTVTHVLDAITIPTSESHQRLEHFVHRHFPQANLQQFWKSIGSLEIQSLTAPNLTEILPDRLGATVTGAADGSQYRFGDEVVFYSFRLEQKSGSRWQVAELSKWAIRRVFRDGTPSVPALTRGSLAQVDNVPFVRQLNNSLCQSAVLDMIYRFRTGDGYPGGQPAIRDELGGQPLSHSARVKWLNGKVPLGNMRWTPRYVAKWDDVATLLAADLAKGQPLPMSTRLTSSGHVLLVHGLERGEDGKIWVKCHDPWGRFNFESESYEVGSGGRDVKYPLEELFIRNRQWSKEGAPDVPAIYVRGLDEWIPSNSSQSEKGYVNMVTKQDWEWIAPQ